MTRCELSQATKVKLQPFAEKIDVQPETFTVALQSDNTAFDAASATFHSEASAREFLNAQVAADPTLASSLHVIPSFELVSA